MFTLCRDDELSRLLIFSSPGVYAWDREDGNYAAPFRGLPITP